MQSGKTTNFTAVIAKMADVRYRLVIVLSGIHNGLRRQTQVRLDLYLKDLNPDRWMTLTGESRDFVEQTLEASAALSEEKTVLAVVKKNAAVLDKLIRWLGKPNSRKALASAPVLIIDDEADQASVATGRINPLIRKLLGLMPRCTYVGYTATPSPTSSSTPRRKTCIRGRSSSTCRVPTATSVLRRSSAATPSSGRPPTSRAHRTVTTWCAWSPRRTSPCCVPAARSPRTDSPQP
ncbi:hypothetical protein ACFQ0B_16995 [Nonomuraea thailandensis]